MRRSRREGFVLQSRDVVNNILIPRYYDPRITRDLESLRAEFVLSELRELVKAGHVMHSHGDYVPKIYYGTGPFPYIRTSDLANWEINVSPKHGVPKTVHEEFASGQAVRPGDIFFVHEGTYLIGSTAIVTDLDGPLIYQHHLAKFTVHPSAPFSAYYLLAALASPLVQRQVRAKQFSADIIDSVVGRLEETVIPVPKDSARLAALEREVKEAVCVRAKLRERIAHAAAGTDAWLRGERQLELQEIFAWEPEGSQYRQPAFLGGRRGFSARVLASRQIRNDVLLPKYYDPWVESAAHAYGARCEVRAVGDLVREGTLALQTGDEIGRLNYGTGNIPFVRTSDFGSWELKREAKQGVSKEVWEAWTGFQDVRPGDVLLVRDGTYLVGTSILVDELDLPLLYCGGIYRIRSHNPDQLPAGLLFALLNTPFVRRQIRNNQFTRDVIDTLGQRVMELLLPIPRERPVRRSIGDFFSKNLGERARLRSRLQEITETLFGVGSP